MASGSKTYYWIDVPFEGTLEAGLCCIVNIWGNGEDSLFGAIYDGNAFHFFGPSSKYGGVNGLGATDAAVENNKFRVGIRGLEFVTKAYGAVFKTDLTTFPFN